MHLSLTAWTALLFVGHLIIDADACGGFFCAPQQPVVQAGEAIAFGVQDRVVTMHVQILYQGPAERFSWLLPVPFDGEIELGIGSDRLFSQLFQTTLPTYNFIVNETASENCDIIPCVPSVAFDAESESDASRGLEAEEGNVGPFDFAILASDETNAVFNWLQTNGYDQPDGSQSLINFYAKDHKFVAIRMNKEFDTGDIVPLTIQGTLPEAATSVACVPIQLTRIAAAENMPIQVYMLGPGRGVPTNFFEVTLDDALVDWIGCSNNPACYYQDHIWRFGNASLTPEVDRHAFLTEFVGSASIMADRVAYQIGDGVLDTLKGTNSAREFLQILLRTGLTRSPLVDSIINRFIPPDAVEGLGCSALTTVFDPTQPIVIDNCVPEGITVDGMALATELDEKVLQPAVEAQAFVDAYADQKLTRLYTQQGPESMIKDPFFAFDADGEDVSNVHQAVGVPVCSADSPMDATALQITLDDGRSFQTEAQLNCFFWSRPDGVPAPSTGVNPALSFRAGPFGDDAEVVLQRSDAGTFDATGLVEARRQLDERAPNQTVTPFEAEPTSNARMCGNSVGAILYLSLVAAIANLLG